MCPPGRAEGEELLAAIRKQVEYYFSRENLASDAYLVQHMNSQMYVPLSVIAAFNNIRSLTTDAELIKRALKPSTEAILDPSGSMVRPNIKMSRNTLVLREISADTTAEDIRAVFVADGCPAPTSVKSDINDTWFVAFDTEEQCMDAHMFTRDKTLKGKPIKARVKSENLLRSFYKPGDPAANAFPGAGGSSSLPSPVGGGGPNGGGAGAPTPGAGVPFGPMGRSPQGAPMVPPFYGQGLGGPNSGMAAMPVHFPYGGAQGRGQPGGWAMGGMGPGGPYPPGYADAAHLYAAHAADSPGGFLAYGADGQVYAGGGALGAGRGAGGGRGGKGMRNGVGGGMGGAAMAATSAAMQQQAMAAVFLPQAPHLLAAAQQQYMLQQVRARALRSTQRHARLLEPWRSSPSLT